MLLCTLCACSRQDPVPVEPVLQDGIWTGTGEGRSGTILVKITIKDQRITDIVVVNQSESSFAQKTINGGNTLSSTGGINAAGTEAQKMLGIQDSPDLFYEDTMRGGKQLNIPSLVRSLVDHAAATISWLSSLGADLSDVGLMGGIKVDAISLNNFKKTYKCPFAYRISGKNFGFANEIKSVPLYAVFCIEAKEDLEPKA